MGARFTVRLWLALVACAVATLTAFGGISPASARADACGDVDSVLAYNIRTRIVGCREARRVVRGWAAGPAQRGGDGRVRGLFCRYRDTGYEAGAIRCTGARGRVVRWVTGS